MGEIDHARNPCNLGNHPNCDGFAQSTSGECGDTLSIWISVKNDIITKATFWTDGCVLTIASGSITTELATGRPVETARNIDRDVILDASDGFPEDVLSGRRKYSPYIIIRTCPGILLTHSQGRYFEYQGALTFSSSCWCLPFLSIHFSRHTHFLGVLFSRPEHYQI